MSTPSGGVTCSDLILRAAEGGVSKDGRGRAALNASRDSGFAAHASRRPLRGLLSMRSESKRCVPELQLHPASWRLLARVDRAAGLALARVGVGVERLVERRQVLHQVLDLDLDAMHQRAAFEAVPVA